MKNKKLALWLLLWTPIFIGAQTYGPVVNRPIQGSGGEASGLTIGSTTVASGTSGRVLYNNSGTLGQYSITGTAGSVVMSTGPTISNGTDSGAVGFSITAGYLNFSSDFTGVTFGTPSAAAGIYQALGNTPDTVNLSTGSLSNSIHFNERADFAYDFQNPCLTGLGTAACTDPTFILHSHNQVTNEAMSLGHNGTQGIMTANGGILIRSLTYASGSDVALTVQGSLTGNIQNWKNSGGTIVSSLSSTGAHQALSYAPASGSAVSITFPGGYQSALFTVGSEAAVQIASSFYSGHPSLFLMNTAMLEWTSGSSTSGNPATDVVFARHAAGVARMGSNATNINALIGGGTAVASAAAMPLPTGRVFHVTGTTDITSITSTNFASGAVITLIFDDVLTFTDGSNLKLAGNFVTTADDSITLVYDGTNWYETARSVN